jgi:hypothetical protein
LTTPIVPGDGDMDDDGDFGIDKTFGVGAVKVEGGLL